MVAIIEDARSRVVRTVNSEMVLSYWHIGREIVEYVQRGESRAEYGEQVIEDLSAQLLARVGRGYSTRNLWYFRDFYLTYRERAPSIRTEAFRTSLVQNSKPIDAAKILHEAGAEFAQGFSSRLSWTHYRALLNVSDPAARAFYEIEAERENWSTPHLERQIFTALHQRGDREVLDPERARAALRGEVRDLPAQRRGARTRAAHRRGHRRDAALPPRAKGRKK